MASRKRSAPPWAADIDASDPRDPKSIAITREYHALFCKNSLEALKHLRTLYKTRDLYRLNIRLNNMSSVFARELENVARAPSTVADRMVKELISAGLLELYFDVVLKDDFFREFSLWINNVFLGLFLIIQWCQRVNDELLAQSILNRAPALWDHIWKSRDLLVRSGVLEIFDSKVRETLANLALQYQLLYDEKDAFPMLMDSRVAHVGMLAWIHMKPDHPDAELFLRMVKVYAHHTRSADDVVAFVQEAAIGTVGPERLLRRFHRALELEAKLDKDLQTILSAMLEYLHHLDVRKLLGPSGMHELLIKAVARQEKKGLQPFRFPIVLDVCRLLTGISSDSPIDAVAAPLIRDHDMVGFMARSVIFCARNLCSEWESFANLVGEYTKIAFMLKKRSGKNELLRPLKDATRQEWYPALKTMRYIRSRVPGTSLEGHDALTEYWVDFGVEVGLKEEVESERFKRLEKEAARFCSWRDCKFHMEKSNSPMKVCVGCQEVRYCDRACQLKDWREGGHKAQCRRLKG